MQVAAAMERLRLEKEGMDDESAMEDMEEDERAEFVKIKKREFEQMEKMLTQKQVRFTLEKSTNCVCLSVPSCLSCHMLSAYSAMHAKS